MAQNDNSNAQTFYVIGLILLAGAALWYFMGGAITSGLRWVRVGEMHLLSLFTHQFDSLIRVLPEMKVAAHAARLSPQHLDWPTFWNISVAVGDIMRWVVAVVFVICIFSVHYKVPSARFKNRYDLEGMIKMQSKVWPVITPIVGFNPTKNSTRVPGDAVPADLPLFAESLSPDEWVTWARIPVRDGSPDEEGVRQALTQQLGPRWEGAAGLKMYHRALLAAFALKGAQRREESDALLGEIAQCWTPAKGLVLTEALEKKIAALLGDKKLMEKPLSIGAKHAYRTTALIGILKWARQRGGVLAPAQFLWLRGQDRALWYPLNNLGRRSYHAEAAGAMAHYMAESLAGKALLMPRVKTAIQPIIDFVRQNGGQVPDLMRAKTIKPQDQAARAAVS